MAELSDFAMYDIDWTLSPEQAVTMYLEWGNNAWDREHPPVRTPSDVSHYFVVDSWQDPPVIRLVRRSMESAEDLLVLPVPDDLIEAHRKVHGSWRGICEPVPEIRTWLKAAMDTADKPAFSSRRIYESRSSGSPGAEKLPEIQE